MLKKILAIGAAVVLYLMCSPLRAAIPETINFATEATFPPFEYMDASGQVKGFEIDMVNAMCQLMKVKCTYSNQPWVSLIPSLKLGKFQAIISAMSITPERQQQVDFTQPYFATTAHFVVPVGSQLVISPEGLKGKVVGVQIGTTSSKYLEAKYGKIVTIKTYPNQQEALLDLAAGRVDTVLGDTPVTAEWLRQRGLNKKYVFTGPAIDDPAFFGVGYGIAVKKGNKELLDAFNKALAEIKANGTWQKIVDAYFKQQ
ncbi:MAG TPA: lysine/arginine/ornithine ABC transporter substrate-binding protein [Gammaproteobacteria bacterium]|nr:lysine/arginine/ornithine ABC transporter substrate-binding protein [Gammaproteobacteria bacterium]